MSDRPRPGFSPADHAELALLLEVAGTPKPGNVDRLHDHETLRFEHFLAGAVGSRVGLEAAAGGASVGDAFERGVERMSQQRGGNAQFGCLLLLVPLVVATARGDLSPAGATEVVEATTVEDAVAFYRSFEHVDVAVGDPPPDAPELDVRRGSEAAATLRARDLSLYDVMALSAGDETRRPTDDGNAREWTRGFERTFAAAERMLDDEGPAPDRIARAFLWLLADEPDTLVAVEHGPETAEWVRERAREVRDGDGEGPAALADEFVERQINPGTTADATAAATFVALERGLPV